MDGRSPGSKTKTEPLVPGRDHSGNCRRINASEKVRNYRFKKLLRKKCKQQKQEKRQQQQLAGNVKSVRK